MWSKTDNQRVDRPNSQSDKQTNLWAYCLLKTQFKTNNEKYPFIYFNTVSHSHAVSVCRNFSDYVMVKLAFLSSYILLCGCLLPHSPLHTAEKQYKMNFIATQHIYHLIDTFLYLIRIFPVDALGDLSTIIHCIDGLKVVSFILVHIIEGGHHDRSEKYTDQLWETSDVHCTGVPGWGFKSRHSSHVRELGDMIISTPPLGGT